jgi:hypothetical protein
VVNGSTSLLLGSISLSQSGSLRISDFVSFSVRFRHCIRWHFRLRYKQKYRFHKAFAKAGKNCLIVCKFYWSRKRDAYSPNMLIKNMLITKFDCISLLRLLKEGLRQSCWQYIEIRSLCQEHCLVSHLHLGWGEACPAAPKKI